MIQDKNEFNMNKKRNRSQEHRNKELSNPLIYAFGDVSENEEEQISDTSSVKHQTNKNKKFKRGQTYSIGYLSKTIWQQKIYSDDFDADFEILKKNQNIRFRLGSVQNSAIEEDAEHSEIENPYFSDNSSSSQLTTKLRKFSLELSKMMDKSDNESSEIKSVGRQSKNRTKSKMSHYNSNLNEPIEEVEDEKEENLIDQKIISKTI